MLASIWAVVQKGVSWRFCGSGWNASALDAADALAELDHSANGKSRHNSLSVTQPNLKYTGYTEGI